MQQSVGLDVRWVEGDEVDAMNPAMATGQTLGASYAAGDGYIEPPRNVLAYTAALFTAGVHVCERTAFTGLVVEGGRVTGVHTSAGDIATSRVVLTGGPSLAAVGAAAGVRIPSGGARHQVVVTESAPGLRTRAAADGLRRGVGDLLAALRGRRDVGDEQPRRAARRGDGVRRRLLRADERADRRCCVPTTAKVGLRKTWAATIDFTPDHLPILGPAIGADGVLEGTVVAAAGGHGMMWGPGVARAAADLALDGHHRRTRRRPTSGSTGSTSTAAAASPPTPSPSPSPPSPDPLARTPRAVTLRYPRKGARVAAPQSG